jgi:hypothetical protein
LAKTYSHRLEFGSFVSTDLNAYIPVTASNTYIVKSIKIINDSTVDGRALLKVSTSAYSSDAKTLLPFINNIPAGDVLDFGELNIPLIRYSVIWGAADSTKFNYFVWGVNEYEP